MGLTRHRWHSSEEQIELLELGMARVVAEFRAQAEEAVRCSPREQRCGVQGVKSMGLHP